MKKFFKEFKEFALQGNVMNLAVGVIIGAAFQGLVSSFTTNLISPLIGLFTKGNLNHLQFEALGATFTYGAFITDIINFLITAFIVFLLVKGMNKLTSLGKKTEPEKAPETKKCPYCYTDIPVQATRCPNCTAELAGAPAVKPL